MREFLLDAKWTNVKPDGNFKFLRSNLHARRFFVDSKTTDLLLDYAHDHVDLFEEQRRFAKPPFPETYVEFDGLAGRVNSGGKDIGILRSGNEAIVLSDRPDEDGDDVILLGGDYATITPTGYDIVPRKGALGDPDWRESMAICIAMSELLWLLMHQPKSPVRMTDISEGRSFFTSPPRFWKAHSTLTIDLSKRAFLKMIRKLGERNKSREHSVRGTWVHFRLDSGCEHNWPKEPAPARWEGDLRYDCPKCKAVRVWRKNHERGNGRAGTMFHDYDVTS